jgi:hypothetical protein
MSEEEEKHLWVLSQYVDDTISYHDVHEKYYQKMRKSTAAL